MAVNIVRVKSLSGSGSAHGQTARNVLHRADVYTPDNVEFRVAGGVQARCGEIVQNPIQSSVGVACTVCPAMPA